MESRRSLGKEEMGQINLDLRKELLGRDVKSGSEMFFENQLAREPKSSLENVRWLTTNEAAQYLRLSISSIKTMIYRGQVRVHKLGRRNRFLREELERLIMLPH
jgi:excisionase family DNA binding protein